MKLPFKTIAFAVLATISASGLLAAQTSPTWSEQLYRAKFGRPSPAEEVRTKNAPTSASLTGYSSAYRPAAHENAWLEQWFLDKYGRHTPKVEARLRELALANRATTTEQVGIPADIRFDNWYRAKYGRPSPLGSKPVK